MIRVLQDKRYFFLFITALIFSLSKSAFATTYVTPTDDQLVIGSRAIVRGRVLAVESAFDRQTGRVWTYTTLRINEVLKGDITQRKITIKEEGGQTAERGSIVFGTPQFKLNEQVILYLDTWGDGSLRVHDMFLGKFTISTDAQSGLQYAERSLDDAHAVNVQSLGTNISPESTEKMELSAYLQQVRSKIAANAEQSRVYEETYYSRVPKLAEPPEFRGLKQQGKVEPQWTYITSPPPRWFEPDDNQPVVFKTNMAGAPGTINVQQLINDVSAAMNVWSTVPGCSMRLVNGGTTDVCEQYPVENTIIYPTIIDTGTGLTCDRNWSGGGCQNILAKGGLSWYPGQTRTINGVTFIRATGGFVSFNPHSACNFANSCIVQEILTHELGHALGLGHSTDTTATMYAIAHFDGRCASLRQDDRDGITFIYPGTGGGGGPLSITTTSLLNGTVGAAYSQTLLATGGTLPYTWTLASGALPAGLTLNSNGTISGTPSSATTANFTVQVRDAAQATAQRAYTITIGTASAQYDSQFVSQTVPTSVQPGQQFNVNAKFLNTGTQPWATGSTFNFYLASQNPPLNRTWGGEGVPLFEFPTAPGQQLNLDFQVTAPITPGTYNFQWQLYQNGGIGFFGQMSQNVVIQVGSGGTQTNNAAFVSQTVPTSMTAGQSYSVLLTMQNTGTTTWSTASYKLGTQNPQDNTTWGTNRATLQNSVAPNANATFTFNVTAPTTPGTYNFQWEMMQEGVGYFGTASTNVAVTVSAAGGTNNAEFVSQNLPSTMTAGQVYSVTVVMRNSGTTTWDTPGGYKLGSQNPTDNTTWGNDRVNVIYPVAPGNTVAFVYNILAPSTAGSYNFQWRLWKQDTGWFGSPSQNFAVTVVPTTNDSDNDGIPNVIEPTVGTNPGVKDNAVFTSSRLFAMQQYRDFLSREAEPEGLQYWINQLDSGAKDRATVIGEFFGSNEFQNGTAPITRLYFAYFLRIPDYEGLRYWLNNFRNGQTLESISEEFAGSPEFVARYGNLNNTQFVTLLYQNVLGRQPDPQGLQSWLNELARGHTRGWVMLGFSESPEFKQVSFNRVFIVQMYLGMVRQIVTQDRYNYWLGRLTNGTATARDVTLDLLNSADYRRRFLP